MKRSSSSAALYLALVFLSGALVGGFGHRLYMMKSVSANTAPRNPEEFRRKWVDEMQTRLRLSPDQMGKLQTILDKTRQRYHEVHERSKPEMTAIQEDQVRKVNAILTPVQQTEYEKLRAEREERRRLAPKNPPGF